MGPIRAAKRALAQYAQNGVARNWARTLRFFEPVPGGTLLDVGCGDGDFTTLVMERTQSARALGIDMFTNNLDIAAEKGIKGTKSDLNEPFPVSDASVDIVVASHVIEHVSDTDLFVQEIGRVLKPGGYAVVATPNLAAWYNIAFLILGQQPPSTAVSDVAPVGFMEQKIWSGGAYTGDIPVGHQGSNNHRRIFVRSTLKRLFEFYGFTCEKIGVCGFPPLPWWLADLACRVLPMYGWQIMVRVRKPL
jgi:SAM-dependent methyltransferase